MRQVPPPPSPGEGASSPPWQCIAFLARRVLLNLLIRPLGISVQLTRGTDQIICTSIFSYILDWEIPTLTVTFREHFCETKGAWPSMLRKLFPRLLCANALHDNPYCCVSRSIKANRNDFGDYYVDNNASLSQQGDHLFDNLNVELL